MFCCVGSIKIKFQRAQPPLTCAGFWLQVLEAFAGRLINVGVLSRRDIPSLTKYQIILARDQYRKNPSAQHAVSSLFISCY